MSTGEQADGQSFSEAAEEFRRRNPRHHVQHFQRGNWQLVAWRNTSDRKYLDESVAAYREALKEYTRERVPLQWARTQSNLGIALSILGERESGTARLEEAVHTFREALSAFEAENITPYINATRENLQKATQTLAARNAQ